MSVTLYTTPSCGYCRTAKDYFKKAGISFTEHDVSRDPARAAELQRRTGQLGVPVIDVNGRLIIGFNLPEIERALRR